MVKLIRAGCVAVMAMVAFAVPAWSTPVGPEPLDTAAFTADSSLTTETLNDRARLLSSTLASDANPNGADTAAAPETFTRGRTIEVTATRIDGFRVTEIFELLQDTTVVVTGSRTFEISAQRPPTPAIGVLTVSGVAWQRSTVQQP
jgi:hypothetical protein